MQNMRETYQVMQQYAVLMHNAAIKTYSLKKGDYFGMIIV